MKKYHCNGLIEKYDQAVLTIVNKIKETAVFSSQVSECLKCDYIERGLIHLESNDSFILNTTFPEKLKVHVDLKDELDSCLFEQHFNENGCYQLTIEGSSENFNCSLEELSFTSFYDTYLPLLYAFIFYFGLAVLWVLLKLIFRRNPAILQVFSRTNALNSNPSVNRTLSEEPLEPLSPLPTNSRVLSLDTFRGIAIVIMIFVNYGGGDYFFFHHLPWNGLSVADLVFPWFIWIMGVSMVISLRSLKKKGIWKRKIFWKIIKRTIILFSLGIILNTSYGANDLKKLRIPGVLQRFAVSYFTVATLHMFFARTVDSHQEKCWAKLRDILLYWPEWIFMISIIALHTALTFGLPVPDCPLGYLGPGGLHQNSSHFKCTGGASGYIDRMVFGEKHIYSNPTCKKIYMTTVPYDPEGLLGCLTSIFMVFLGLQAGKILMTYKTHKERLMRWIIWGSITGTLACILCKGSKDDGWIPVNKNLWSLSFVLTTSSFAFFLLSFCYILQDIKRWWTGTPFFYPGMNSILLYVGHELTGQLFPWSWASEPYHGVLLAKNLWGVSLWVIIAYCLFKKKIFLSI